MSKFYTLQTIDSVNLIELHLPNTLDISEFDRLNEGVLQVLDGQTGSPWVIDLSNVRYIGSAVLGLMVNIRQRIKAGEGTLVLCGLSAQMLQVFRASCLERMFVIARSRAEAIERAAV